MSLNKKIILLFTVIFFRFASTDDLSLNFKCKVGCKQYYTVQEYTSDVKIPKRKPVLLTKTSCGESTKVYYLFRRFYKTLTYINWGSKPKYVIDENLIPDHFEAAKWVEKNQCKIGKICPPNGDCWGSWSTICDTNPPKEWVDDRQFQFKGATWSTSFHDACTFDWTCSIKEMYAQITINDGGQPQIQVDGKYKLINEQSTPQYFREESFGLFLNEPIHCSRSTIKGMCFEEKGVFFCEIKQNREPSVYIEIGPTKCSTWGHFQFCIEESQRKKVVAEGRVQSAGTDDVKEVAQALNVMASTNNINSFIIKKEITVLKNQLNKLLLTLLRTDPMLFSAILGTKVHSRLIKNNMVEICPCEEGPSCKEREEHNPELSFCVSKKDATSNITLLGESEEIFRVGPAAFDFVGIDVNVIMDHLEESFKANHKHIGDDTNSSPFSLNTTGFFLSQIAAWVGPIALILSIFNLLRK